MSKDIANQVFLAYMGRPADAGWRTSTANLLNGSAPSVALQNAFFSAAVLEGVYSLSDSSATLVNKIFQNIFGFSASTFEQTQWGALINSGVITAQTAAWTIFNSYLGATNVPDAYKLPTQSKLVALDAYVTELGNNSSANVALSQLGSSAATSARSYLSGVTSVATAASAITGVVATVAGNSATGSTFSLTSNVDTIVGTTGSDTITGSDTTFTGLDSINGGAGVDTLTLSDVAGAKIALTSATITNVEKLVLSSTTGLAGGAIDISGNAAYTDATISLNAAAAAQTVTASATLSTLSITNSAAQNLDVVGGAGVLTITNGAGAVKVGATTVANAYTSAVVKGGTTVAISDTSGASAATGSKLTSVSLDGNTGAATLTSNGLTAVTIANGVAASDVTIANTTVGHTQNLTVNNNATGLVVKDAAATTVNVTTTGKSSAIALDVAAATAVSVSGTVGLTLDATGAVYTALKTVTVAGSGGLTADVSGAGALTSVDASTSTGANAITIDATKSTFAGGSGADTVTITAAPTKSIDGGAGTADVLTVNIAGGFNASGNTNIKGFEVLGLGALANAGGNYDATGFTGLTHGAVAAAVTYTNVAAGAGLTLTGATGFAATYTLKDASGTSDSLALTLNQKANTAFNTVTAAGVETVTIAANDTTSGVTAGTSTYTLTLAATAAKTITATGNANLTLTNTGNTAVTSIDASAMTGAITVASAGGVANTIKGGAGKDTLTASALADTLTGGAGADNFIVATPGATVNVYTTITDATAGDIIVLQNKGNEALTSAGSLTNSKVTLASTAVFQDYANAVIQAGGNAGTSGKIGWFQFGGDTYIVQSNHDGSTAAGATFQNNTDLVVKLTGLIDLTKATFTGDDATAGFGGAASIKIG